MSGHVFTRLFLEHPRSMGESYLKHQRNAFRFGLSMGLAGLACLVHGLIPALFVRTGSNAVTRLQQRMVVDRAGPGDAQTSIEARIPRQFPNGP